MMILCIKDWESGKAEVEKKLFLDKAEYNITSSISTEMPLTV